MTKLIGLSALMVVGVLMGCGGAPVANAGADYTADPFTRTFLDASGSSDPGGQPLTFEWVQVGGDPVTLTVNQDGYPEFTAPNRSGIFLTFKVKVSNGHATAEDTVGVGVGGSGNRTPISRAGSDRTVTRTTLVTLNGGTSTDSNGDTLTYLWEQVVGPPVTLATPDMTSTTFNAPDEVTDLDFRLTVADATRKSIDHVIIHVVN